MKNLETHPLTSLLKSSIKGVLKAKIEELRMMVTQASKTFDHNQMTVFAEAAKILSRQSDWGEHDMSRARCMALYHMYLMFYRDSECAICKKFLCIITACYLRALRKAKSTQ